MVLNINLLQLTTLYVINYVKNYLKYYNISMVLNINLFQYRANLSNTRSSCHVTLGSKAKTEKKKWIQLIFYYKNKKFSIFPTPVSVSSHVERLRNVQNKERESEKPRSGDGQRRRRRSSSCFVAPPLFRRPSSSSSFSPSSLFSFLTNEFQIWKNETVRAAKTGHGLQNRTVRSGSENHGCNCWSQSHSFRLTKLSSLLWLCVSLFLQFSSLRPNVLAFTSVNFLSS